MRPSFPRISTSMRMADYSFSIKGKYYLMAFYDSSPLFLQILGCVCSYHNTYELNISTFIS